MCACVFGVSGKGMPTSHLSGFSRLLSRWSLSRLGDERLAGERERERLAGERERERDLDLDFDLRPATTKKFKNASKHVLVRTKPGSVRSYVRRAAGFG